MFVRLIVLATKIIIIAAAPSENFNITKFIGKYNYPVETHNTETPDGYVLGVYRIPHGLSGAKPKEVVLLVHGLSGSAENFLVLEPPDALPFYLSDRGYDVWLFNARGTAHSRKHRSLNPNRDRKKFWDFSWHEIGKYDLPSTINHILMETGKDKISYIGHSQGTTSFFVMLSELPEMNDKIKVAALMAPAVKLNYTLSPLLTLGVRFLPLVQRLLEMFNWHELIIPNSPMLNRILVSLCSGKFMIDVCMDVAYIAGGAASGYLNKTVFLTLLETSPSGFSTRQVYHYAQIIETGEFKRYDFGKKKNLKYYNSSKPPLYNLSNARVPIGLFYTTIDPFANDKMTEKLAKELPNVVLKYEVKPEGFNHIDFVVASNAKEAVYEPLYQLLQKYEGT